MTAHDLLDITIVSEPVFGHTKSHNEPEFLTAKPVRCRGRRLGPGRKDGQEADDSADVASSRVCRSPDCPAVEALEFP